MNGIESLQLIFADVDGRTVRLVGRMGHGPGEFEHIQLVASEDSNRIVAYDAIQERVTLYTDGEKDAAIVTLAGTPLGQVLPEFRYANGDLLVRKPSARPDPSGKGVVRGAATVVRISAGGAPLVSYGSHPENDRVLRLTSKGGLTGGDPPFPRQLLVAAVDSVVYVAPTGPYQIDVFRLGGTRIRSVRVLRERKRVTQRTILSYRARVMQWATDPYTIREWTMLSSDDVFPKEIPAFDVMLADRTGAVWIRESEVIGQRLPGGSCSSGRASPSVAPVCLERSCRPRSPSRLLRGCGTTARTRSKCVCTGFREESRRSNRQ